MLKKTGNVWGTCPDCDSGKVKPFNTNIIIIAAWIIIAFLFMWNHTVGFFSSPVAVIITVVFLLMDKFDKKILKCEDCNKFYIYDVNKKK